MTRDPHDIWAESRFGLRHRQRVGHEHGEQWQATRRRVAAIVAQGGIAVLLGPRGTGKTQLACNIAHEVCFGAGQSVRYFRLSDFAADMKSGVFDGKVSESSWLNLYAVLPLLVLDEVHEMRGTEFNDELFRGTIDRRYMKRRPTILISNFLPDKFAEFVGESVMSRISECGEVFKCNWASYREDAK